MPQTTTGINADDEILAQFFLECEKAADRGAIVAKYSAQYPHLKSQFQDLPAMQGHLSGAAAFGKLPERQFARDEILGDYRIENLIRVGGMGEIYKAHQISLKRFVALKVMRKDRATPEAKARFDRERAVLAKLHQTNIVPVYAAGREGDIEYFAMQYIDGASLSDVLFGLRLDSATDSTCDMPPLTKLVESLAQKRNLDAAQPTGSIAGQPPRIDGPTPSPAQPNRLSMVYWRSVSQALAEAADAVDYAHQQGIFHRDLKPSNLMLDRAGRCHVIDFGLANDPNDERIPGSLQRKQGIRNSLARAAGSEETESHLLVSQAIGTQAYMAPEQFECKYDARTDVWGLGVVLHEMLALNRPYEGDARKSQPLIVSVSLPSDLSAICAKALHRDADGRYATAKAFGADLRHWLNFEPTEARGARPLRRAGLWARRNPGWAVSLGMFVLACLLFFFGFIQRQQERADERVRQEAERTEIEREARRQKERESLIQKLQRTTLTERANGWSSEIEKRAQEVGKGGVDFELRSMAAIGLQGLDARLGHRFEGPGSSVAFSRDGKRVAIGGFPSENGSKPIPARLLDVSLNQSVDGGLPSCGPVTFDEHNRPLQLAFNSDGAPVLWNMAENKPSHEFKKAELDVKQSTQIALAENGKVVAAAFALKDGKHLVLVWEVGNDKPLKIDIPEAASALSLSPDGKLLASGGAYGKIRVWSLPKTELLAELFTDRSEVNALSFGRDVRRRDEKDTAGTGWLLATGAAGGVMTIWDMHSRSVRSVCRGYQQFHIHCLAFSPDGMTMAVAGRRPLQLWDVATGALLLSINDANTMTGVAFSPDGENLAVCSIRSFDDTVFTRIWKLDRQRGIHLLRGMSTTINQVTLSPDGRFVAALGLDSRLGIWELKSHRLLHVFDAPKATWVDNAAICFSPDSKRLAYSGSSESGGTAKEWEVESGNEVNSWKYEKGMQNILAYHPGKQLLLFQAEGPQGKTVCKIRQLKKNGEIVPFAPIGDFKERIASPKMPTDGRFVVLVGYDVVNGIPGYTVRAFDSLTGKIMWTLDREAESDEVSQVILELDREGKYLTVEYWFRSGKQRTMLFELPGKKPVNSAAPWSVQYYGWSPDMPYRLELFDSNYAHKTSLVPKFGKEPVIGLDLNARHSATRSEFSADGRLLAWGNNDGTVMVADIEEVRKLLKEIGLEW